MPKINHDEYEILKGLDEEWKWIARDSYLKEYGFSDNLWIYEYEPIKGSRHWIDEGGEAKELPYDYLFRFIQWEDEEPHNITELIEEYEIENGMRYDFGKIKLVEIDTSKLATHNGYIYVKESEETEVKNNKLNRKTLDKILTEYFDETALSDNDAKIILDYHNFDDETLIELALGVVGLAWGTSGREVVDILDDFDKLDEPELADVNKPIIPQFVAEHIEKWKNSNVSLGYALSSLRDVLTHFRGSDEQARKWLYHSVDGVENQELYARAWLDGYEVVKEPKYLLKHNGKYLGSVEVQTYHDRGRLNELGVQLSYTTKGSAQIFTKEQKERIEKYLNVRVEEMEE